MKNSIKMKTKSLNLIKVFGRKEAKFWKRTMTMKQRMNWFGFIIGLIFISIGHYAFALMHFLFECFLFVAMRPQFKANLNKMYLQTI